MEKKKKFTTVCDARLAGFYYINDIDKGKAA